MTTPTTVPVGHGSKQPTVVQIDGFRGRLISADHPDYDIARAVRNGAIDRRPRLIARRVANYGANYERLAGEEIAWTHCWTHSFS
jgi:hypothetical protein